MLVNNKRIIKHKFGLMNLAEELGNVSMACKTMGLSRDTFYRYKVAVAQDPCVCIAERCTQHLAINDIEHSKTKVRSPQTNGLCEHSIRPSCGNFTGWPYTKSV